MNETDDIKEYAPWMLVLVTLVGVGLRFFSISTKGLWLDETFSLWLANHSVGELLQWVARVDQHPPLYYFLLHYWISLTGDAAGNARILSALFGAGTIPMIYLIGKRISGVGAGLAAATILALSPFNIFYSQEARMYTLLMFNASVAIYALSILLTDPRSSQPIGSQFREYVHAWRTAAPDEPKGDFSYKNEIRSRSRWRAWINSHRWLPIQAIETDLAWVALILFTAATLLSHNTAILFLLAINLFVVGLMLFQRLKKSGPSPAFQAPSLGNWVKAQVGILILWGPWLSVFIKQASRVNQEFWIPQPGLDTVIQTLKSFLNASAPAIASWVWIWVLYAGVLIFGLLHYLKKMSIFLFLAALFAIPILAELIVSIRRPIYLDRTLIWTTIPLFLLLAAGISQLKFRPLSFLVLGILATLNIFSSSDYFRYMQKENWTDPAGYVAYSVLKDASQKDDLILFNSNFVQISFDHYFGYWEDLYSIQVEKRGVPANVFEGDILERRMTANDVPGLIASISGRKRVWLVYSHNSYTDPQGLVPQTLASKMKLIETRDYYGVQVLYYEAP